MSIRELEIEKRRVGRNFFRKLTRKTNPVDLGSVHPLENLVVLLENRRAAESVLESITDPQTKRLDLSRLNDREVRDLLGLKGVGEGTAGKIAALVSFIGQAVEGASAA